MKRLLLTIAAAIIVGLIAGASSDANCNGELLPIDECREGIE